jgi:DNA-binding LacI/PurR family transcriptional regulator
VVGNDKIAIGAVRRILQCGWAIFRRVSVVGFDDIAPGSFVTTAVTTVALPLLPMGVAAGEMILCLLAGVEQPPENLVHSETHRP